MNDLLRNKLTILNEDKAMFDAVKYVFEQKVEQTRPDIDKGDNDVLLGSKYRAYLNAKRIIEEVWQEIESFKETRVNTKSINKGK